MTPNCSLLETSCGITFSKYLNVFFFILPKCLVIITDFGIIEFEMQQLLIHVKCNSKSSVTWFISRNIARKIQLVDKLFPKLDFYEKKKHIEKRNKSILGNYMVCKVT